MRAAVVLALLGPGLLLAPDLAAQGHDHSNHAARAARDASGQGQAAASSLAEAGNGAFATVQEVVRLLESRPDTDWEAVDLEALRRHLVDMENVTLRAEVLSADAVPGGVRLVVRGTGPAADASIRRALSAHAAMIAAERDWSMHVEGSDAGHVLTVTSPRADDAAKIRGLGYIGIMALGDHHAPHHWLIATGGSPHGH